MKNTANNQLIVFRFDLKLLLVAALIFAIEVIIALYVTEKITRSYIGDTLVVILIYYFLRAFVQVRPAYLATAVLLFAYAVEIGQYFNLITILGLEHNQLMRVIIGTSFSWIDMLAYTVGAVICYLTDRRK